MKLKRTRRDIIVCVCSFFCKHLVLYNICSFSSRMHLLMSMSCSRKAWLFNVKYRITTNQSLQKLCCIRLQGFQFKQFLSRRTKKKKEKWSEILSKRILQINAGNFERNGKDFILSGFPLKMFNIVSTVSRKILQHFLFYFTKRVEKYILLQSIRRSTYRFVLRKAWPESA